MLESRGKTLIQDWFYKNDIVIAHAAKELGLTAQQLYRVLNGTCRPNSITAKKLVKYTKGALRLDQIRPPLDRPRCPCCGRLANKTHLKKIKAQSKEALKIVVEDNCAPPHTITKKERRKIAKNWLLDIEGL